MRFVDWILSRDVFSDVFTRQHSVTWCDYDQKSINSTPAGKSATILGYHCIASISQEDEEAPIYWSRAPERLGYLVRVFPTNGISRAAVDINIIRLIEVGTVGWLRNILVRDTLSARSNRSPEARGRWWDGSEMPKVDRLCSGCPAHPPRSCSPKCHLTASPWVASSGPSSPCL